MVRRPISWHWAVIAEPVELLQQRPIFCNQTLSAICATRYTIVLPVPGGPKTMQGRELFLYTTPATASCCGPLEARLRLSHFNCSCLLFGCIAFAASASVGKIREDFKLRDKA